MKLSNIANVFDVEHDNGRLIEIGLTTVAIQERLIVQSFCLPMKPDFELTPAVSDLTGWTTSRLLKQGVSKDEASRRLAMYGSSNRLLVTDHSDEIPFLENSLACKLSPHRLNISILLALLTGNDINLGLEEMLEMCNMKFEGRPHSAVADSKNIARLFLRLLQEARGSSSIAHTLEGKRLAALDELAAQAQELNMGYEEK
jgi:DNA polymerase III alpha subunit (gram-positive type)